MAASFVNFLAGKLSSYRKKKKSTEHESQEEPESIEMYELSSDAKRVPSTQNAQTTSTKVILPGQREGNKSVSEADDEFLDAVSHFSEDDGLYDPSKHGPQYVPVEYTDLEKEAEVELKKYIEGDDIDTVSIEANQRGNGGRHIKVKLGGNGTSVKIAELFN
ncbi:hypothetical protein [Wolbachia endosymbiont of Ctenocephalides felis wCfeT]|uniref:hypothetical protein n=1 Tax=Wolbachia endosymbiont of Ctenocephalides felis wCfeT TaxID=2732593 RepID=UPI0014463A13|nr:hypothetical protein [Wolbachia endosymbiont of Ctenocephalides felis wCfeT]